MISFQLFRLNPSEILQANTFSPNRGILQLIAVGVAPPLNRLNTTLTVCVTQGAQITSEATLSFVAFVSRPTSADLGVIGERAAASLFPVVTTMSVKDSDWTSVIPHQSRVSLKLSYWSVWTQWLMLIDAHPITKQSLGLAPVWRR